MRTEADRLNDATDLLAAFQAQPYRYDFYQVMRRLECLFPDRPRFGTAARPCDEPVRLGQQVAMDFAPAAVASVGPDETTERRRLRQRFFGLHGPNGPLPLHLTEYVYNRSRNHGDQTLVEFLDLFHHRLLLLFYRAWAQARPTVSLDRPAEDRYADFVGSLIGVGSKRLRGRDTAGDEVKLFHAGELARQVRSADGLQTLVAGYFRVPVDVDQFVGHWMPLPADGRTRLGARNAFAQLGISAVVGAKIWDAQHRFRLRIGPLSLPEYEAFLPTGTALPKLVDLVRQFLSCEFDWDLRLVLKAAQQPRMRLGRGERLGWTSWLGVAPRRPDGSQADRDDLRLDAQPALSRRAAHVHRMPDAVPGTRDACRFGDEPWLISIA